MAILDEKDLVKMANKIYINPTKEVLEFLKHEYNQINENLKLLKSIDVDRVEPLARISKPLNNILREDEPNQNIKLKKSVALANASERDDDYIVIRRIFK